MVLTFVDRINISVAIHYVQLQSGLRNDEVGRILSAYVLGYALFQIPGGILADRLGPRKLLVFAVLWWSLFTALTAAAKMMASVFSLSLLTSFCMLRFLVGVGEAASMPSCNRVVAFWIPANERSLGNSLFLAGIGVGGGISPPLVAWIMSHWGWRSAFVLSGIIGLPIAMLWGWYGRDRPSQHKGVNATELAIIGSAPDNQSYSSTLKPHLKNVNLWILVVSYFLQGYVTYIFYTWFYLYVVTVRHVSILQSGYWASIPFIAVALMTPLGGLFSDRIIRILDYPWGRRLPVLLGTTASAVLLSSGARTESAPMAIVSLGLAAGFVAFSIVNWWASINELSVKNSATLSGIMNTAGNIGGVISPILTPWIAARFGWIRALDFAAVVIFVTGLLWLLLRPRCRS